MLTSIIIPTRDRRQLVANQISALLPCLEQEREIIIVDDGSTDETAHFVETQYKGDPRVRLIPTENRGRAVARNCGAQHARGQLLIFLDDDVEIRPDFLRLHEEVQSKFPHSWVTGPVHQKIANVPHKDFLHFRAQLDIVNSTGLEISPNLYLVNSFSTPHLSVSKAAFLASSGFLEHLSDCEDFELSVRVKDMGHKIIFDNRNVVFHCDFKDLGQFISRQHQYMIARAKLAALRPDLVSRYPDLFVRRKLGALERIARRPFIYSELWRRFSNSKWRKAVPLPVRLLLYDFIISSTVLSRKYSIDAASLGEE